ncbi:lipase 3 [Drosophila biarmipes]|uniref:lipase 3 n=1 Tax=Drosophila biarmipes TaxID=125945 RepID=UPI0007E63277|nr:lipase 3 [Drosophila biarmipes]
MSFPFLHILSLVLCLLSTVQLGSNTFLNPFQVVIPPNVLEDALLDTFQLIIKYGYPAENYTVQTDDGYRLSLFRIARPGAMPVLMVHGLLDSSATWVMMGPSKSLGYFLYDQGYDVWMTNVRGNMYSKHHVWYSTDDPEFWNFSFHEMGVYDLPSTIDFVLMHTGFDQLQYVGHSQGSVIFWVLASEKPEYMDKVSIMQALAPVAFLTHCRSPIVNFLAAQDALVAFLLRSTGFNELLPSNYAINFFKRIACHDTTISIQICQNLLFIFFGFNRQQLNETMLPVVVGHTPAGASTKQLHHFGQVRNSRRFQHFDYGLSNLLYYGSLFPPLYKLQNVRTKVALYYGSNDWLAPPEDVDRLYRSLPNVVDKYVVPDANFNHLDFIWGIDARELVWDRMIEVMKLHVPQPPKIDGADFTTSALMV